MQGMKNMNNNNQHKVYTDQLILFIGMFFIALIFDMMNVMVNSVNDLYLSKPLICSSLYMASTMLWGHQIIHYIQTGRTHFNTTIFFIGVIMSLIFICILRYQIFFSYKDWIKGMIPHHSMAVTTTKNILEKESVLENENNYIYRLAKDIVYTQEREIIFMKNML